MTSAECATGVAERLMDAIESKPHKGRAWEIEQSAVQLILKVPELNSEIAALEAELERYETARQEDAQRIAALEAERDELRQTHVATFSVVERAIAERDNERHRADEETHQWGIIEGLMGAVEEERDIARAEVARLQAKLLQAMTYAKMWREKVLDAPLPFDAPTVSDHAPDEQRSGIDPLAVLKVEGEGDGQN